MILTTLLQTLFKLLVKNLKAGLLSSSVKAIVKIFTELAGEDLSTAELRKAATKRIAAELKALGVTIGAAAIKIIVSTVMGVIDHNPDALPETAVKLKIA